ncbi:MAG TPA: hypothetical protein VI072_25820 [Polyangiaceae bacterium]
MGFFAAAVYFRQRYVGGCDWWAYYAEAQNLLGRAIPRLAPYPDLPEPHAQMPLCMELVGGKPTSFFLPGFPLLVAIAGLLHAEFLVNPVLGALTGWMLHLIARPKSVPAALFATSIWLSSLLTFWGSTQLMSDDSRNHYDVPAESSMGGSPPPSCADIALLGMAAAGERT